jgi:outer membrane protein assembly factor BamD
MVFLRNELARSDLMVARYYATRNAWVAVTNRTKFILLNYQGSSVIKSTLELQLEAYQALDLEDLAHDTQRIIDLNYNKDS